jgi:myo-inositol-1(or 4)-monophosphatase
MGSGTELEEACIEAVRRGGAILAERFTMPRTIRRKGRIDLVTDADRASEEGVVGFLRSRFPAAAILAEESGEHAGGAGAELRFYVDPLDGTTNYAHGVPHFAVTVAVADAGGLAAGAVLDPVRGELFAVARGAGAFLGERRLEVSGCDELHDALLVTGFAYDWNRSAAYALRVFGDFNTRALSVRRLGSAALDLAYVAAGRFDGFWEERLHAWDVAAGILMVREAGGLVSDLDGGERMLETGDILAAPPALLPPMLEVVGRTP